MKKNCNYYNTQIVWTNLPQSCARTPHAVSPMCGPDPFKQTWADASPKIGTPLIFI